MIVCYAFGDGLGHLTRVTEFLRRTGRAGAPVTLLTGSAFAADPRVTAPHTVRRAPAAAGRAELAAWLRAELAELPVRELVVDAFPAGLRGELTAELIAGLTAAPTGAPWSPGIATVHLARLLRWDVYAQVLPDTEPLRFDRTLVMEPVTAPHRAHLEAVSGVVEPAADLWPQARPAPVQPPQPPHPAQSAGVRGDDWLIVHSGPAAEVAELVEYARETAMLEGVRPRLVLITPDPFAAAAGPLEIVHLDVYPAWPLFDLAGRVITAAGFNAVHQLAPWRAKHRMLPFPRRLDDQYTRAALATGRLDRRLDVLHQ